MFKLLSCDGKIPIDIKKVESILHIMLFGQSGSGNTSEVFDNFGKFKTGETTVRILVKFVKYLHEELACCYLFGCGLIILDYGFDSCTHLFD
jgi:hypothetical protein